MEEFLTLNVRNAIIQHMNENPAQEVGGVIEKKGKGFIYVPRPNVHKSPADEIAFDAETSARIFSKRSNVVAYVHTHPNGPAFPSVTDQKMQLEVGKPSVIASREPSTGALEVFSFGDHMLDAPLMGRIFKHYVTDCYEALRSWVWQNEGVKLDSFPRDDRWWNEETKNDDLYEKNFASQGYREFTPDFNNPLSPLHPRIGDVILMQLDARVINHAAVYVGENKIYHHRMNKKSGENAIGYLIDNHFVRKWLRREPTS